MKKLLALVLAVLMVAGLLVACGGDGGTTDNTNKSTKQEADSNKNQDADDDDFSNVPEPTQNPNPDYDPFAGTDNIELTVWAPQKAVTLTEQMCEEFKKLYPNKTISIKVTPMEEGDSAGKILNDPDVAADVFSFAVDQIPKLYKAKVLSSLGSAADNIVKYRDEARAVKSAIVDGKIYAYPETGENGYYLVYDKEYVTDEDAKTLEGVLAACRKAGMKFSMDAGNGFYAYMFLFTGGMELTGLDGDAMVFTYDEEKVLDSLEAFNKLFTEYSDVFQSDQVDKIGSGMAQNPQAIAAGIDGSWNASVVQGELGENYGAVKLPTINIKGVDTQIVSLNGYKLVGVNARSKFTNAAHLLAEYLTNEECQRIRAEKLSWSPSNKNLMSSDVVAKNKGSVACLAQADYSIPQNYTTTTSYSPVGTLGNYIATGGIRTREDLKEKLATVISSLKDE